MKKITSILLISICLITLSGCKKEELSEDKIPDLYSGRDILPGDVNYYYTFSGESNNVSFKSGRADYLDDKAEFVLKDIEVNNKLDYYYAKISVYFNDKLLGATGFLKSETSNGKTDSQIAVLGKKIKRDKDGNFYGDIDSFTETEPDKFAESIKVEFYYCKHENCDDAIKEELKLDIIKHD